MDTLGVLTVGEKQVCLGVPRGRVRLIRCYLQYIHASRNRRHAFRLRRLAESGCLQRVLVVIVEELRFRDRRSES